MSPIIGLQQRIEVLVRADVSLERIAEHVIEPSGLDADRRAALWFFAVALERRRVRTGRPPSAGRDRRVGLAVEA